VSPTAGVQFTASDRAVLDASGNGTASVGPMGADWVIRTTTVSTSTQVRKPQANTYRGGVSQANLVDGSSSGQGDTSDTVVLLQPGEQLSCVWTGGDVGATAFLRVTGVAYPAGQGILNL
jgi:hypothetical protein